MSEFENLPPDEQEEISTEAFRIRTMLQAGIALDGLIKVCEILDIKPDSIGMREWIRNRQNQQVDMVLRICSDLDPHKSSKIKRYIDELDKEQSE